MRTLRDYGLILLLIQTAVTHGATTVTQIAIGGDDATGANHSLFLKSDGSLWVMGYNFYGQLGDGRFSNTNRPERIVANGVVAVAGGLYSSLFVKSDGSLWTMGLNNYGQLGDGTTNNTNTPEMIVSSNVTAVASGTVGYHSLFLKSDGSLWAMGRNKFGQIGDGTTNDTSIPEQIVATGVVSVARGYWHSVFLKSDGSLWGMGLNDLGQLGDGTFNSTNTPEQIVSSNVIAIACGGVHSLFLKSDGSLWGMGDNTYNELGIGFNIMRTNRPVLIASSNVITIACGDHHSLFVKSDGSLWGLGDNKWSQLGLPIILSTLRQIVSNNVVAVAGGGAHTLFLKSDGSLWGMGLGSLGQLGDGFASTSSSPEQIVPSPQPVLKTITVSKTDLRINATCLFGGAFYLLSSTNLTQPVNQWLPVRTNSITDRGSDNFSVTLFNALNPIIPQQFYFLKSQ